MKKTTIFILTFCSLLTTFFSCKDTETYAEMKDKEKKAITAFIKDNDITGPITVISENTFYAQDSTTNLERNEYVLFEEDGIYMQIISKGSGKTFVEMAKEQPDSTVTKNVLCRFLEYDIESADTTNTNFHTPSIVDKMLVKYTHYSHSYMASFTEGAMKSNNVTAVPKGWFKPFNFIRLSKDAGKVAKVRMIIPHASGTSNASGYVLPFYYEISYQLGK